MQKAARPPHHYDPHPDDVFIFPDRAFAPGYEPSPPNLNPRAELPYGRGEMMRFLAMLAALIGGIAMFSAMFLQG
ncbi:hypothetical protein EOD42_00095 [Rhodovarius crocodyli]|uniref:Uncharacterized protein n=1 Tax=Rhodovarius crocodyli TaxID=1979269 RepID=A0A437MLQ3_9PROT|nr:hypothetical protein [Rhodovarius crocodyli]RVT98559.1 hypothetical protein EOD42_00095 [Rhodovarius crocodyli]